MDMDIHYMREALALAKRAAGRTTPNPMVGAVLVRDGQVVGRGWHKKAGDAHAEINALRQAGEKARGATLYVTLEPCCHYGRTGPCAKAVIEAGVARVVAAMTDPNPLVAGCGLSMLREAGIEVAEGVLAHEAARMNEIFIKYISVSMPFAALKYAMTLDGRIAAATGDSKWVTGSEARLAVHHLRDRYDAILAGVGTVLADDPQLTTRLPRGGRNPVRVVVDSLARTPLTAQIIADQAARTLIAVTDQAPRQRVKALQERGVEILTLPLGPDGVKLRPLFQQLASQGITSILVEGGAKVNASILADNLADKVYAFIAPKIIGGDQAPGPVGGKGRSKMSEALALEEVETRKIGQDILLSGYLAGREGRDVYRTCGRIGTD